MNTNEFQMTIVSILIACLSAFCSVRIITVPMVHMKDDLAIIVAIAIGGGVLLRWISDYISDQLAVQSNVYTLNQESRIKLVIKIFHVESILSICAGAGIVLIYLLT